MQITEWRTDKPPLHHVVEVWYLTTVILAAWDGRRWRTADGAPLGYISHWRERK